MSVSEHPIIQILDNELGASKELLDLLKAEQAHLIAMDTDALNVVTEQKTHLLARMTEMAALRSAAFAQHDLGTTAPAIGSRLAALGTKALSLWNDLIVVATEAKELNRTNGVLIARQMANNQIALQHLQTGANAGRLYGPNGQSSTGATGRTFAAG